MKSLGERTVLAIDPGRSKCGVALVKRTSAGEIEVLWRAIVPTEDLCAAVAGARDHGAYGMIVCGDGTRSRETVERLREQAPSIGILVIDEKDTSLKARERYWEHHPRKGWRRLVPATLQTPPEPVDDFVALILAERVLAAG